MTYHTKSKCAVQTFVYFPLYITHSNVRKAVGCLFVCLFVCFLLLLLTSLKNLTDAKIPCTDELRF